MKKLEVKHIVGYLPYGLEAITIVDAREDFSHLEIDNYYIFDKNNIWTYCGYAEADLCIPLGEGEFNGFILRHGNSYADIQNFVRPILRPLSDLAKEIEVNGHRFIPMEELFTLAFGSHSEVNIKDFRGTISCENCIEKLTLNTDYMCFKTDAITPDGDSDWNPPFNQLQLFEKIYEWHFDVHELIPAGLAIDKNTLT